MKSQITPCFLCVFILLFVGMSIQAKSLEVWYVPCYACPALYKQEVKALKHESKVEAKARRLEWKHLFAQSLDSIEWLFVDAKIKILDDIFDEKKTDELDDDAISCEAERIAEKIRKMKEEKRKKIILLGDHEGAEVVIEVLKLLANETQPCTIRQYILLQPSLKHLSEDIGNIHPWTVLPGICVIDKNDSFYDGTNYLNVQQYHIFPDSLQLIFFTSKNKSAPPAHKISERLQHTNLTIDYLTLAILGSDVTFCEKFANQRRTQENYAITYDFRNDGIEKDDNNDITYDWWELVNSHANSQSKYGGFVYMYQNLVSGRCKVTDRNGTIILSGKKKEPLCGECHDMAKEFDDLIKNEIDILNYTKKGRMDAELWWEVEQEKGPFRLEKHKGVLKIGKNHCRIIHKPSSRCVISGTSQEIERFFQIVDKQWHTLQNNTKGGAGRWDETKAVVRDNCLWKDVSIKHEGKKERKERLQRSNIFKIEKHCETEYCRIVNFDGICVFAGDLETVRRKFEEYKDVENITANPLPSLVFNTVWHIPGWKNDDICDIMNAYAILFPGSNLIIKTWDNKDDFFSVSSSKADLFAKKLIAEIQKMSPAEREQLTIVGHSLGGRIATRIAAALRRANTPIKNICILGSALPCVDSDSRFALEASVDCQNMTVIHVFNPRDKALKFYKGLTLEGGQAMGSYKFDDPNNRIHQFCVTWNNIQDANVPGVNWDFIKGLKDHNYLNYMIRLKQIAILSKKVNKRTK